MSGSGLSRFTAGLFGGGNSLLSSNQGIFSDRRLKQNIREIAEIGGLKVYEWDWVPEADDTIITLCNPVGFMADEVKELYPQHVYKFGSFDVLDYESILAELEVNNG